MKSYNRRICEFITVY